MVQKIVSNETVMALRKRAIALLTKDGFEVEIVARLFSCDQRTIRAALPKAPAKRKAKR